MTIELGKVGVWRPKALLDDDLAVELERLGYGAIWIGGSPRADLELAERLLDATRTIAVATGIVNIWKDDATTVAASHKRIDERHPGRFLVGIGAGHPEATPHYGRPYAALAAYLDGLDSGGVPVEDRVLAALGPRVLRLAAERSAGAHPYLITPVHTRQARELLGAGPLLAPEQKVILETDTDKGRAVARQRVAPYLGLRNYTENLRRLGYTDADLAGEGSDRLIDDLVPHGDAPEVARGITAHLDAGADHVCIQVLGDDPLTTYRTVAGELF